jgi:hypothetical protein
VTELAVGLLRVPAPVAGEILHEPGFTRLFAGSLLTAAVICDVPPAPTGFTDAERLTTIPVPRMSVTEADFVLSANEVATIVTVIWLAGGVLGAVYVVAAPLAVVVGETVPHGAEEQLTLHVTPMFEESLITCAVTPTVPPASNVLLLSGVMDTEMGNDCVDPLPPLQPDWNPTDAKHRSASERRVLWLTGPPNAKPQGQINISQSPTSPDSFWERGLSTWSSDRNN